MSDMDIDITLWCLPKGEKALFPVATPPTTSIATLKDLIERKKKRSMAQSFRFDASTRCIEPQTLEGVLFLVIYFDFMEDTTLHVGQCGP